MIARLLERKSLLQPVAALVSWVYLYLVALLGLWVLLVMLVAGWSPVVITSGSMSPTLRPGDVIMVDDHPDELVGQRAVITFDSGRGDGQLITHRVFEVLSADREYITKGDANPSTDSDRVPAENVTGLGRVVVPLIGTPVVWAQEGDIPPIVALAVLSIGAIVVATSGKRPRRREGVDKKVTSVADRAIRRVRVLVGLMITAQFLLDGERISVHSAGLSSTHLVVIAVGTLAFTTWLSSSSEKRYPDGVPSAFPLAELIGDTLLVVFLTTATGGTGIGWVLMALPIVEAAVRFRLAGALLQWMLMAAVTLSARLWVLEHDGVAVVNVIDELEALLDQLGVLLLVVIPGAYLAEQLVADVLRQRAAADAAMERGLLLEQVAEVGNQINRIGPEMFATLVGGVRDLGFVTADVVAQLADGSWRILATAGPESLPEPGVPGSGLRLDDLSLTEVVIDAADPDPVEMMLVAQAGLSRLLRVDVTGREHSRVCVRAGEAEGHPVGPGAVQALRLLCAQTTVAVSNSELVTELRAIHDELEHQANHDVLTGLPNRAFFVEELRSALLEPDPTRPRALFFLDLNGFKAVNDKLGHDAGDELLKVVGGRITTAVGGDGLVARLGGDEFTVLVRPVRSPREAEAIVHRIHAALAEPVPLKSEGALVGASVGIAYAEEGITDTELLRRADAAMYAAKETSGSNRMATYDHALDDESRRRGRIIGEFKKALERNELALAYQPIVTTNDHRVVGVEALLRWTHRELGSVGPPAVLELAEAAERVDELNAWILQTALGDLASWAVPASVPFYLAVNASPEELDSPTLVTNISDALAVSGISPSRLVIELSERVVTSRDREIPNLEAMRKLGVRLSLDDFGEGRTSLAHLRHLPIQQLKLDRILVQQACSAEADQLILSSVVGLAHELGFDVVAEGIETTDHESAVERAGADLLQGYGLYRPMPATEFHALLIALDTGNSVLAPGPSDRGAEQVR